MPKAREIRKLTDDEMRNALEDAKAELFNLRLQWVAGTLEDYTRLRALRKDIARYHTILREREIAAQMVRQEEEGNAE